jgi:hypothetical protein
MNGKEFVVRDSVDRRTFIGICASIVLGVGIGKDSVAAPSDAPGRDGGAPSDGASAEGNSMSNLHCPLDWLNAAYQHSVQNNVLAALNPKVFFGYFSVCADGQGFGYANTYPSLDGHQLSHALLFLGRKEEVLANWEYVKRYQKPSGHLPIMIDSKGEGLYVHWCPGDPLRALGAVTYAHNAYAIYTHTLDDVWLRANLQSVNLAMEYLASLVTPDGRVGGAGFYVEMPTRIEWDGVSQCYAVDALQRVSALNAKAGESQQSQRWAELAGLIRANFRREFWRGDHCVEYIHPDRGPMDRHGLTDVDWASLATGLLPEDAAGRLWNRLKDERGFRYGGMPTGIATAPETYEDWEFIPAEQFPKHDRRHDLAAMGRVWYLESWARARHGDVAGLCDSMRAVAEVGAPNKYAWQERYFPSKEGLRPGGPLTYCEYPANLIRIVNQFLIGVEPDADGVVRVAPQVPKDWWAQGWRATLHIGDGVLAVQGDDGRLRGTWHDAKPRQLQFLPPSVASWRGGAFTPDIASNIIDSKAVCGAPAGTQVAFELRFA